MMLSITYLLLHYAPCGLRFGLFRWFALPYRARAPEAATPEIGAGLRGSVGKPAQRLVQIGDEVVHRFDPDREPNQVRGYRER